MKSILLRSHLTAGVAGLIFAFFCGAVSIAIGPPYMVLFPPIAAIAAAATFIGFQFLFRLARLLGPYDLFTVLPGLLGLAAAFGIGFMQDTASWYTRYGRFVGTLLGPGPPPWAVGGQIFVFACYLAWIAFMVWAALAWKRTNEAQFPPPSLTTTDWLRMRFWLGFDTTAIACLTTVLLTTYLWQRIEFSKPENVLARLAQELDSPAATLPERFAALQRLESRHSPAELELLRRAAREQPTPVNLLAASHLLGRDDAFALPMLEPTLMQTSYLTCGSQPANWGPGTVSISSETGFKYNITFSLRAVTDPQVAPILIRLMDSPNVETRRGAAAALRTIQNSMSLEAMIRALDDDDQEVRYFAVCTLMELDGNPGYPSLDTFRDDEQEFLKEWRAWAQKRANL
jgi:hypothetical protein